MNPGVADYISYEVKKEIAARYFGFRKLIEEDKLALSEKIKQYSYILEKRICFDLLRLYVLFREEQLINAFLDLAGIEAALFYDSLLPRSSAVQDRVFENVRLHGLTRAGRFRNFGYDCYERLCIHIEQYNSQFAELRELRETINEEIKLFYRKNDLTATMGFLRAMGDHAVSSGLEGGMEVGMAESLEKKMRIDPPFPIEHFLPVMPSLPPLAAVRPPLTALLKKAYGLHDEQLLVIFASPFHLFLGKEEKASRRAARAASDKLLNSAL